MLEMSRLTSSLTNRFGDAMLMRLRAVERERGCSDGLILPQFAPTEEDGHYYTIDYGIANRREPRD